MWGLTMFYPDKPVPDNKVAVRITPRQRQNPSPCQTLIFARQLHFYALLMCRKRRTPPRWELCRHRLARTSPGGLLLGGKDSFRLPREGART